MCLVALSLRNQNKQFSAKSSQARVKSAGSISRSNRRKVQKRPVNKEKKIILILKIFCQPIGKSIFLSNTSIPELSMFEKVSLTDGISFDVHVFRFSIFCKKMSKRQSFSDRMIKIDVQESEAWKGYDKMKKNANHNHDGRWIL